MNGYGNIIFSVSLLTSQVGGLGPHPMWGEPHPTWGGPHSTLELGGGGGNIIPGCFLPSQYEWLWEHNIFSQSVDIPGGGVGPHPTWGGPYSTLELGGGGGNIITLSQVAFYHLNMNGYGNIIFSVSLLTSQVGGWDPIPHGGTPSHVGGTPSLVHEGVFFDMRRVVSLFGSHRWTLLLFKYLTFLYLLYLEVFLEVQ